MENSTAYELLSLIMRYVFVFLGAFIALYALGSMRRDARIYRRQLRSLPDAGKVGELFDREHNKHIPLPREGMLGSGRGCDAKLRGHGIAWNHAIVQFVSGKGLRVTPCLGKRICVNGKKHRGTVTLIHGDELVLGSNCYTVRFFKGLDVPHPVRERATGEELSATRRPDKRKKPAPAQAEPVWGEDEAIFGSGARITPGDDRLPQELPFPPGQVDDAAGERQLPFGADPWGALYAPGVQDAEGEQRRPPVKSGYSSVRNRRHRQ